MELIKLNGDTYLLDGINKVGIYVFNQNEVVIIDTGMSDQDGMEIIKVCKENNWQIKMILNTHGHTDHIGGNQVIQKTLKVPIYAYKMEQVFIENPILISTMAYGGFPHQYLKNPYLLATASEALELTKEVLPKGIEFFPLPGHNGDMVGFKTKDEVYFLADAIAGQNIIAKHQLQFMFDVKAYFKTLDYIKDLKGKVFVPSHGEICENIEALVAINKETALSVIEKIKELCQPGVNFETLLKELATFYHIKLEFTQYCLIGTTLKCYLSYLLDEKIIQAKFINNELIWTTI